MAITFRGAGTVVVATGPTAINPALPETPTAGDLLLTQAIYKSSANLSFSEGGRTWGVLLSVNNSSYYHEIRYRTATGDEGNPTWTPLSSGGEVAGVSCSFRGIAGTPLYLSSGLSYDTGSSSSTNIGPITAAVASTEDGAVIVFGHRNSIWTDCSTLSGDGLTWAEAYDAPQTSCGLVMDYAIWSGGAPTLTAKTITVSSIVSSARASGIMVVLQPPAFLVGTGTATGVGSASGESAARGVGLGEISATGVAVGQLALEAVGSGSGALSGAWAGSATLLGVGAGTGSAAASGTAVGMADASAPGVGAATLFGTFLSPPQSCVARGHASLSGAFDGRTNIPPYLEAAKRNSRALGFLYGGILRGTFYGKPLYVPNEPPPVVPAPGIATGGAALTGTAVSARTFAATATGRARFRGNWDNHRRPNQTRIAIVIGVFR